MEIDRELLEDLLDNTLICLNVAIKSDVVDEVLIKQHKSEIEKIEKILNGESHG